MAHITRAPGRETPGGVLRALVRVDGELTDRQRERLPDMAADVVRLARAHRVSGLLARRIESRDLTVPQGMHDALEEDLLRAQGRHLIASRTVAMLAETLSVPFVVVKGPVLASAWYREAGARAYTDVDLLVRPQDFPGVLDRLSARGGVVRATNWANFHRLEVAEVPIQHGEVTLDVHWHLVGLGRHRRSLALDTEEVLARGVSVEVAGTKVSTLDAVDTLLHLCVHGGLAGARRLLHLLDVDVVVRSGSLKWSDFVARAWDARAVALSSGVLCRARETLGTPVPDEVIASLEPFRGWRQIASGVEGLRRRSEVTGRGLHLEGARDTLPETLLAVTERTLSATRLALGGTAATGVGGDLSWRAPDPDEDQVAAARKLYVDWVGRGAQRFTIHETRDSARLYRMFGALEPRSSSGLAYVCSQSDLGRVVRAYVVRRDDGRAAGFFVVYNRNPLQKTAWVVMTDPGAAAAIGQFLQRSSIAVVAGFTEDVAPLRPHVGRWLREYPLVCGAAPPGTIPELPDRPDVRRAQASDLDALTRLIQAISPDSFPHPLFAQWWARRALRTGCTVLDPDGGGLLGYATIEASTPRYDVLGTIGILPEARGHGRSWDLLRELAAMSVERGSGILGMSLASNPMTMPVENALTEDGLLVTLRDPRRFKGETRLWRAARRLLD